MKVSQLLAQIKVEFQRHTNLILLRVQDTSKERAARIANEWASAFIESNEEVTAKNSKDTYIFVTEQLENAKQNLKAAEEELEAYQKANKIELLREQVSGKIKQIVQYGARLEDTTRSQLTERARFNELTLQIKEEENIIQPQGSNAVSAQAQASPDFLGIHEITSGMTLKEANDFIERESEIAQSNLAKAENEYKEYGQRTRMEILQSQMSRKVSQLADMKLRLTQLGIDLHKQQAALDKTEKELMKQKEYIPVDKGLIGKEELNSLYTSLNSRRSDTTISLSILESEREELTKTVQTLETEIQGMKEEIEVEKLEESRLRRRLALAESQFNILAQYKEQSRRALAGNAQRERVFSHTSAVYRKLKDALMESDVNMKFISTEILQLGKIIGNLNEEVAKLKKQLAEEELVQTRLGRNVETARSTFEVLSKKAEETKIASAIKSTTIKISVPAVVPDSPVKPKKKQNVMIAAVLGLFASTLLVFFMEFWTKNRANLERPIQG